MPFTGEWSSPLPNGSGDPAQHTADTAATYLRGNWAEDMFADNTDVKVYVTAPNGGAISITRNASYAGGA